MLTMYVIAALAIYWLVALYFVRRSRKEKVARRWAWLICVCLFAGDHVIGYLWFSYYSSYVSVNTSVKIITEDLAIETYANIDLKDAWRLESVPIIYSIRWALSKNKKSPYNFSAEEYIGYSIPILKNGGSLEIVNAKSKFDHPNAPQKIVKFELIKKPNKKCHDYEDKRKQWLPNENKKTYQENFSKKIEELNIKSNDYCISREESNKITSRYSKVEHGARTGSFLNWGLSTLFGVYPVIIKYIDNVKEEVIYEEKILTYTGGWVWQLVTFFPNESSIISQKRNATKVLKDECCLFDDPVNFLPKHIN